MARSRFIYNLVASCELYMKDIKDNTIVKEVYFQKGMQTVTLTQKNGDVFIADFIDKEKE